MSNSLKATIIKALRLAVLFITPAALCAYADPDPDMLEADQSNVQSWLSNLEGTQLSIGDYVHSFGEGLDRFFGSDELEITGKRNKLKVYLPLTWYQGGRTDSDINFKLQIDLPRTNHRWKLFLSSFSESEETGELPNTLRQPASQTRATDESLNQVGARYLFEASKNRLSYIESGLKLSRIVKPNPFVKYRERYKTQLDDQLESRTQQTVYLEADRGLALEFEQIFDFKIEHDNLIRGDSRLTWWRQDHQVLINQRFIHFSKVSPLRARAIYVSGNWLADNQSIDFDYVDLAVNWRQRIYKDWLYAELEPKVTWYDEQNKLSQPQYSLLFQLEMHFYKVS